MYEGRGAFVPNSEGKTPEISRPFGAVEQFYPNIRFPESEITYALDPACDKKKEENILSAFSLLSSKTVLRFSPLLLGKEPRIRVLCSDIAPNSDERGHFVAGEGGPSELINVSAFYVILESKISLYRVDRCPEPKIALHELLHALGFNHTSDPESIMYLVSSCTQQLDESIVQEINRLYAIPSVPDLSLDAVSVNRIGGFLSFQANVSNRGFMPVISANLSVYEQGTFLSSFTLADNGLPLGATKILTVKNLKVSKSSTEFEFVVEIYNPTQEIRIDNNRLGVSLEKNLR